MEETYTLLLDIWYGIFLVKSRYDISAIIRSISYFYSLQQMLAWETVSLMRGELYSEVSVVFENVRFNRATNIPKEGLC